MPVKIVLQIERKNSEVTDQAGGKITCPKHSRKMKSIAMLVGDPGRGGLRHSRTPIKLPTPKRAKE